MRAQRVIRRYGFRHQIGPLRIDADVNVLAVIAIRPAVETAVLYRGHVVRHEIVAEFVAFVDGDPERAALRLPRRSVRIANPRGEYAPRAAGAVHLKNRRTVGLGLDTVFADIAVGADGSIQFGAVGAGGEIL